ncbi:hypothetical protein BegalDRAFT_2437 [Beggiatoa alba B18LD]|uniref:Uncharacterized protein n=1 Tax=Beggiatoa alba B18LD TaxID=395493 RepID=I3CI45_9GAMM|nr:hypothetical protein [Beggiatoa alba]EIJ43288.1 hypothetical protein BegalDRAFT_2437 [Beggiatoa alba B18LD]
MGQSICLSLVTKVYVAKPKRKPLDLEKLTLTFKQELPLDLSLFDFSETEEEYCWNIKPTELEQGLLPFLEAFYSQYYTHPNYIEGYQRILDRLRQERNALYYLDVAKCKYQECFQDDSKILDYLPYRHEYGSSVRFHFDAIILALAGKIYLEMSGGLLKFLNESVQLRFKAFPLAKCLNLYISE